MTKLVVVIASALALAACGKQETAATNTPTNAAPMAAETNNSMAAMNGTAPAAPVKTGDSTGVVKAVDTAAGTVTLDHQPIPGVGWPAMTMTFQAMPPTLLNGVKAGDHVKFSVRIEGDKNEVTAISPS